MTTGQSIRTATLTLAIATLIAATPVIAGPEKGWLGPEALDRKIERMTETLELTPEQQGELRDILEEQRTLAEQQRQETQARVRALMTPEQLDRIDEQREARMERHLDRLTRRLALTSEQVEQVRGIMQAKVADPTLGRAELRERISTVLTEEQRQAFDAKRQRPGRGGPGAPCANGPAGWEPAVL